MAEMLINVVDMSVSKLNHINIAVINEPNPVTGYMATAEQIFYLINIPKYKVTDENGRIINGENYYEYFPGEDPHPSTDAVLIDKTITENGTYYASSDDADGYYKVTTNIPQSNIEFTNTPTTFDLRTNIKDLRLEIPSGIKDIGEEAFKGCTGLTEITFPNSVTDIGSNAFYGCINLPAITIPDGVTTILDGTFYGCESLETLGIPSGVTDLGDNFIANCILDVLRMNGSKPPTATKDAFTDADIQIINIPLGSYGAYTTAEGYPSDPLYLCFATFPSGETLPTESTDNFMLTWYATLADALAETNPITIGNGNEVYARAPEFFTLTGIPPLNFDSNGQPLTSVVVLGNTQQTGTPSPDNIIMPEFVGARTGNLFDKSSATIYKAYINDQGYWLLSDDSRSVKIPCSPNTKYTLSIPQSIAVFRIYETSDPSVLPSGQTVTNRLVRSQDRSQSTFTTGANAAAIIFQGSSSTVDTWFNGLMLNVGSTALPYEPYGWAEKITCGGQTTPVYLGETPTVRQIKKLVLDGTEDWSSPGYGDGFKPYFRITYFVSATPSKVVCTHYTSPDENISVRNDVMGVKIQTSSEFINVLIIRPPEYAVWSIDDFKWYLAQQYAAGTPVTIWYVLAEPETGIVNEPLAKIGDYADTLTIGTGIIPTQHGSNTLTFDTTVQPSEVTITGQKYTPLRETKKRSRRSSNTK